MSERLRVVAIEPYYWHSHRMFLEGYRKYSRHEVEIWDLPARKWKWRMRGAAYHFAEKARQAPPGRLPDVIFASDFLNLADWRALSPPAYRNLPAILYFHENQLTYPLSDSAPVDYHYGWINLSSALAADEVLFNSSFHRERFLAEVERVLSLMPDHVPEDLVPRLRERSAIVPVGIDFEPHEALRGKHRPWSSPPPAIVWNHRWEYDKDPQSFVDALLQLRDRGLDFRVVICGESFGRSHPAFDLASVELKEKLVHLGFFPSAEAYREAVAGCDIVVSTARHEFFGVSVVEAAFLGCLPVLPNALSYPEIIPPHLHPLFLYEERSDFPEFLARFLAEPPLAFADDVREAMGRFHWRRLAPVLDARIEQISRRA